MKALPANAIINLKTIQRTHMPFAVGVYGGRANTYLYLSVPIVPRFFRSRNLNDSITTVLASETCTSPIREIEDLRMALRDLWTRSLPSI